MDELCRACHSGVLEERGKRVISEIFGLFVFGLSIVFLLGSTQGF